MLAAIVVLLVWLIRAARAAPHLTYARQVMEYQASQYQQIQQYYQQQNSGAGVQQAAPPPGTGGYHQYPAAPTTMPGASQPQQTPTQAPPDTGDKSDGPPAQG